MTLCPACNAENIEGVAGCAQCGQPMGDLAIREPTNRVEKSLSSDSVSELRPAEMIVVSHDKPVDEVLNFMLEQKIGCVFVTKEDAVVGVFTERDAMNRLNVDAAANAARPIADFMTPEPKSLEADASIAFAVRMMDQGGYRHILVVDREQKPAGVTSVRNILGYLAERMT